MQASILRVTAYIWCQKSRSRPLSAFWSTRDPRILSPESVDRKVMPDATSSASLKALSVGGVAISSLPRA